MTSRWLEIPYEVTTPMFLGGHDQSAEFRVPGLRGPLRFWFRALAGPYFGLDTAGLSKLESEVFGGVTGSTHPSGVSMRTAGRQPPTSREPWPQWLDPRAVYLLGPGLARPKTGHDDGGLRRSFLAPGASGLLKVSAPADIQMPLALSLWALAAFGGLGARVRRGMGGIRFDQDALQELRGGVLPPQEPDITMRAAAVGAVARMFGEWIQGRVDDARRRQEQCPTPYPMLDAPTGDGGGPYWRAGALDGEKVSDSLRDVLVRAARGLRDHLASRERPEEKKAHKRWVNPEYLDVVVPFASREEVNGREFSRAAFGLPVNFPGAKVNLWTGDGTELRRASMVWVRPFQPVKPTQEEWGGKWRLAGLGFYTEMGPAGAEVRVVGNQGNATLSAPQDRLRQRVDGYLDS